MPWISLLVRRVRDATGNGLIALIGLIWQTPFFGQIAMLALLVICMLPTRERDDASSDARYIFVSNGEQASVAPRKDGDSQ